jgi:hypothetical protein
MTNQEWIQELEDNQSWTVLDHVCFSNGKVIYSYPWFDELFHKITYPYQEVIGDEVYLVIRSNRGQATIFEFLRSLFLKVAEIEVIEIPSEDISFKRKVNNDIRVYAVEYKIIKPESWERISLARLIYYMYIMSSLIDYPFGKGKIDGTTLGNIVYNIFHGKNKIDEEKFFHTGMASLLNNLIGLRKTSKNAFDFVYEGPRFVNTDIEGIEFVLQSREDLKDAIDRVNKFDASAITDEILIQYDTMRRNF